ncbi:MAG: deoxyribonuclease IV [Candidatus Woesebacteria bacterium]
MNDQLLLGAHVSTSGGIFTAPKRGKDIGANVIQIFCASPQIWSKTKLPQEKIDLFNVERPKNGILQTVIHSQYLINLASEKPELLAKSNVSLSVDMEVCAKIGAVGVVVHVGSHMGKGWDAVKEQVVKEIAKLLSTTDDKSVFLIENAAGQKGKIGSDLREIRWMLDQLKAGKRVGWCLDSCHAFGAGYSLVPMDGEKYLFDEIAELDLKDSLKVVHVNDSRDEYLSHRDRHANLYDGMIGKETMHAFLTHKTLSGLPLILEIPGMEGTGPDKENIERLTALCHA